MGRQLQFHMLESDAQMFFRHLRDTGHIDFVLKSDSSSRVSSIIQPSKEELTMSIWNKELLPELSRKPISNAGNRIYRVDDALPTIEFVPSQIVEWNNQPALLQGRIYIFADNPEPSYARWYSSVARWLRAHLVKCPVVPLNGYMGHSALNWFFEGGILLPMFIPPLTDPWTRFAAQQERIRRAPHP